MQTTSVKCARCGIRNFVGETACKRCQAPLPSAPAPSYAPAEFYEYSAPDGNNTVGVLKFIGVLCVVGCGLLALLLVVAAARQTLPSEVENLLTVAAIGVFLQGVVLCALFFAIGIIAQNLVAIRKNTAHLAGIRASAAGRQPGDNL